MISLQTAAEKGAGKENLNSFKRQMKTLETVLMSYVNI